MLLYYFSLSNNCDIIWILGSWKLTWPSFATSTPGSEYLFTWLPYLRTILLQNLWFTRVLQRFNEHLLDSHELYAAIARPLFYMLDHCESHNIHKLRPWIRRIVDHAQQKAVRLLQALLEVYMSRTLFFLNFGLRIIGFDDPKGTVEGNFATFMQTE